MNHHSSFIASDEWPFSNEELAAWERDGYIVLRQAVSESAAQATAHAVWNALGMDARIPATWYPSPPRKNIMVELYHHQALWDNRQAPRIHRAFAQLLGTEALWVSDDRCSMHPPNLPPETKLLDLHWDVDISKQPRALGVQGLLYLTPTEADQGAFQCVAGFHRRVDEWLASLPKSGQHELRDLLPQPVRVPGGAGDLVIWRTTLPHGPTPNRSNQPRLAQYITMRPAEESQLEERARRVQWWQQRLTGLGRYERGAEHYEGSPAQLSSLGRRLLGADGWSTADTWRSRLSARATRFARRIGRRATG